MTDLIVIGAGMAGMTACLYALRQGKSVTIIEKNAIGGQIAESPRVENYPSVESISGIELADKTFSQIINKGAEFEFGEVTKLEKKDDIFYVYLEDKVLEARAVVVASGCKHRKFNLPNEEKLIGHGISYCALCDGAFYAGEDIVLIGDANTALQYALLLSGYAKSVHIVTLFDKFFGDQALIDNVLSKENIKVSHNLSLKEFVGEDKLEGLVFENTQTHKEERIKTKAVFVAIGQVANNEVFKEFADLDKNGYFVRTEDLSTKTPGLFVAGDATSKKVKQVATAISDGAIAATSACNYLLSLK
ncbi:MAG: FAD-dependent oxidoreductase [Clostridia bacterium]|nr:FAD-dependent oxidoreductase [Clostridia bacterium]